MATRTAVEGEELQREGLQNRTSMTELHSQLENISAYREKQPEYDRALEAVYKNISSADYVLSKRCLLELSRDCQSLKNQSSNAKNA